MTASNYDRVEEGHGYKYILTKAGKRITFYDAETQAKRGLTTLWRSLARMGKLAQTDEEYDWDWEHIDTLLIDVEMMVQAWRNEERKHRTRRSTEERIAQLRNVTGRAAAEAQAFLAKADELERTL